MNNTYIFKVLGNPIAHSLSPYIHSYFAKQFNLKIDYQKQLISTDNLEFENYVVNFFKQGGSGLNITLPFKEHAYNLAKHIMPNALYAKAVNTLWYDHKENKIYGDNTDGVGLVNDIIYKHNITITDKNILILGAGGASKGVLYYLTKQNPANIVIVNRTLNKAIELTKQAKQYSNINVNYLNIENLTQINNLYIQFDIIINATSMGMDNNYHEFFIDNSYINQQCFAYDMIYNKFSPFIEWAKTNNIQYSDGLGMLIQQAAQSFYIWTNYKPQTDELYSLLKLKLN